MYSTFSTQSASQNIKTTVHMVNIKTRVHKTDSRRQLEANRAQVYIYAVGSSECVMCPYMGEILLKGFRSFWSLIPLCYFSFSDWPRLCLSTSSECDTKLLRCPLNYFHHNDLKHSLLIYCFLCLFCVLKKHGELRGAKSQITVWSVTCQVTERGRAIGE